LSALSVGGTNVIVSSLLQALGPPAQVFSLALSGSIQLCITAALYAEYEEVIRRPRFSRDEKAIAATLTAIREKSLWLRPTEIVWACANPDDNIFLECAQAARATHLVTGNLKHFPASWLDTWIVTPRQFLDTMAAETQEDRRYDAAAMERYGYTYMASRDLQLPADIVSVANLGQWK
jgi:putative PIN family toxin of toxin-antitoxin system